MLLPQSFTYLHHYQRDGQGLKASQKCNKEKGVKTNTCLTLEVISELHHVYV